MKQGWNFEKKDVFLERFLVQKLQVDYWMKMTKYE